MSINPSEASTALHDIASVERKTREALFYGGSSSIFILWGLLVACGYALAELAPQSARFTWLGVLAFGCAATTLIIALRARACAREHRDWRIVSALLALAAYGAAWSFLLGPLIPRQLMYAFQPTLFHLGMILAGLWLGRFFIVLGMGGIALTIIGYYQPEPWLRLWMALAQSGTLILGGLWLRRSDLRR